MTDILQSRTLLANDSTFISRLRARLPPATKIKEDAADVTMFEVYTQQQTRKKKTIQAELPAHAAFLRTYVCMHACMHGEVLREAVRW